MSDLNDKLQEILWKTKDHDLSVNDAVAQLLQTFTEAGYAHYETVIQKEVNDQLQGIQEYYQEVYMSGEQFYDRFKAELEASYDLKVDGNKMYMIDIGNAARRAAGIEGEETNE